MKAIILMLCVVIISLLLKYNIYVEVPPQPKQEIDSVFIQLNNAYKNMNRNKNLESINNYLNESRKFNSANKELKDIFLTMLAKEVAKTYKIKHWKYLRAIWFVEAQDDPTKIGDNGEGYGLGQVHLKSAKYHVGDKITPTDLMDPLTNGFVSGKILSDYLNMYHGDYTYAIAAYNQGPSNTKEDYLIGNFPNNYSAYVEKVLKHAKYIKH